MGKNKKWIEETWFKDHVAKLTRYTENLLILDWCKPETNAYKVRYIFDGCYLFVSGDLGEATFCLTWNAGKEGLKSLADKNIDYIFGKLSAWKGEKYSYDREMAKNRIQEEIEKVNEYYSFTSTDAYRKTKHLEILEKLKKESQDCMSNNEWQQRITCEGLYDELTEYDPCCYEWIFSVGKAISNRMKGYLIGIKMAYKQFNNKASVLKNANHE